MNITTLDSEAPFIVYNFTVDTTHICYTTTVDTLVHNCDEEDLYDRAKELCQTRANPHSTVAVAQVRSVTNSNIVGRWVATEVPGLPGEWRSGLSLSGTGERYILGTGRAEATIVNVLEGKWTVDVMASSTRMCGPCFDQAFGLGLIPSNVGKGVGESFTRCGVW